jgi:hypothetical protein
MITRNDLVWFGMGICSALLTQNLIMGLLDYSFDGKGAREWHEQAVTNNAKYIDLVSCSKAFNQCSYVVDECRKGIE